MSESVATELIRQAIVRGFTRDDLLFMGELVDYTFLANRVGIKVPTAVSIAVDEAARRSATCYGVPLWSTRGEILSTLFESLSCGEVERGETIPVFSPGIDIGVKAHVGKCENNGWVVTLYEETESAAVV
ncbi:MAG TPA: hypothetical protein VK054_00060 [Beutenbergiaceae bacterium]|nr:hypothetical protein [Beutenbergiaceae bacterium]